MHKLLTVIGVLSFLFFFITSFAQMNSIDQKISDLKQKYPISNFTKEQMYQDFDSLFNIFKSCDAQLEVRKQVTNCDILLELKKLKKEIDTITNSESFIILLYRTLRLSQDAHCEIGSQIWFYKYSIYKKDTKNYDDESYGLAFNYEDVVNKNIKNFLWLKYIDGKYYLLYPITIYRNNDSIVISAGSIINSINKLTISDYIKKFKDIQSDLRWDFERKCFFVNLLKKYSSFQIESVEYIFNSNAFRVDSVKNYFQTAKPFNWDSYDVSKFVKYLPKDSILYIRCPLMNSSYIKYYKKEITKLNNQPIKKVVIDIRGNYGGNDDVWIALLRQIIDKPFKNTIFYLSKINSINDQFIKNKGLSTKKTIFNPIWDLSNNYNVALNITEEIKPFRNSLNFSGNLYVLQDEEIYSSASCFSDVCLNYDKLISIGCANGQLGGQGIEAMPLKLPNSKMIIQMDIFIDNSNAKTAKDVYHSEVEIPVVLPIEYYIEREKYYENIPTEEYLYKHDILFKKVLELK